MISIRRRLAYQHLLGDLGLGRSVRYWRAVLQVSTRMGYVRISKNDGRGLGLTETKPNASPTLADALNRLTKEVSHGYFPLQWLKNATHLREHVDWLQPSQQTLLRTQEVDRIDS